MLLKSHLKKLESHSSTFIEINPVALEKKMKKYTTSDSFWSEKLSSGEKNLLHSLFLFINMYLANKSLGNKVIFLRQRFKKK